MAVILITWAEVQGEPMPQHWVTNSGRNMHRADAEYLAQPIYAINSAAPASFEACRTPGTDEAIDQQSRQGEKDRLRRSKRLPQERIQCGFCILERSAQPDDLRLFR